MPARLLRSAHGSSFGRRKEKHDAGQVLRQTTSTLAIDTAGRGLVDITSVVATWVADTGIGVGLLIRENADPDVRGDLGRFFKRLVPEADPLFRHQDEGPDDMPAHVRAAPTTQLMLLPTDAWARP